MNARIKTGETLYRTATIVRDQVNKDTRTVPLSFSSEQPVERWWGTEILDHTPTSVRMDRLRNGAPLLVDHSTRDHVGVIEEATIGPDRKGRAIVRFGNSARANEIFQDVQDGIRQNISVGYQIHRMVLESEADGVETYRAMDWMPLEISITAVPADNTVGIGRSDKGRQTMSTEQWTESEKAANRAADNARAAETERVENILAVGQRHNQMELAQQFISAGKSDREFNDAVLQRMDKPKPIVTPRTSYLGLSERDQQGFSWFRLFNALATGDWREAGLEREMSDAAAKRVGKQPNGAFVPMDILTRGLTKGTAADGGNLVATNLMSANFIDLLRNAIMAARLGATVLEGLVGEAAIPRQTASGTAAWVAEGADVSASQLAVDQVTMTPKTVGTYTDVSRKLLLQSTPQMEFLVQQDLARTLGVEIDRAAIAGSGSGSEPRGILNTSNIGSVVGGTNGAAPTWANIVSLEGAVADANADFGSLAYLTNSKVRTKLKTTLKNTASGSDYVWPADMRSVDGLATLNTYKSAVSNNVPSTLTKGTATSVCSAIIFGNFADLLIGMWGVLDVLADRTTLGKSGGLRIRVLQDVDVAVRHPESFAAFKDVLTT
jgi:HK97 family phage major capsid protein